MLQTGDTTFAWTATSVSNATTIYGVSVFRGVDNTTPQDVTHTENLGGAGVTNAAISTPGITTVTANAMVVRFGGRPDDMASTPPTCTGYTIDNSGVGGNSYGSSTVGTDGAAGLAYAIQATAGGTPGTTALGITGTGWTAVENVGITVALRPAGAATPKSLVTEQRRQRRNSLLCR